LQKKVYMAPNKETWVVSGKSKVLQIIAASSNGGRSAFISISAQKFYQIRPF